MIDTDKKLPTIEISTNKNIINGEPHELVTTTRKDKDGVTYSIKYVKLEVSTDE